MFKEVSTSEEAAILAASASERKRKGPDYSIRTVTHWMTFSHHMGFCTVPSHYENVPDTDYVGEKYDKYPSRMVVTITPYEVCRWCYIAEGDKLAELEGQAPVERTEENAASN